MIARKNRLNSRQSQVKLLQLFTANAAKEDWQLFFTNTVGKDLPDDVIDWIKEYLKTSNKAIQS